MRLESAHSLKDALGDTFFSGVRPAGVDVIAFETGREGVAGVDMTEAELEEVD